MRSLYDKKVDVLAGFYGISVEKIFSLAAQCSIEISLNTTSFDVYIQDYDIKKGESYIEAIYRVGGMRICEENCYSWDAVIVDETTFEELDAGILKPKVRFKRDFIIWETGDADRRCTEYKVLRNGKPVEWDECVFFLEDKEIQKLETILGVSVPEDQKVEEAVSERKTAQERRESEFDRFITEKQINISVMNASEAVELIMKELSNKNSEYLDKKIWSITDTHIKDFYSKYRKDRGYKTNRGRPRGR